MAFGATATHCAFYPMTGTTVDAFRQNSRAMRPARGLFAFRRPNRYLPRWKKLVKARIAENAARQRDDSKRRDCDDETFSPLPMLKLSGFARSQRRSSSPGAAKSPTRAAPLPM